MGGGIGLEVAKCIHIFGYRYNRACNCLITPGSSLARVIVQVYLLLLLPQWAIYVGFNDRLTVNLMNIL